MKNVSQYLRLKDNHPTLKKFEKLCSLAEELGLSINVDSQQIILHDLDQPKIAFLVKDIEDWAALVCAIPPTTEYYIRYENPEYIALQAERTKQSAIQRQEKEAKELAEKLLRQKAEQERVAIDLEKKERAQLVELKRKYE